LFSSQIYDIPFCLFDHFDFCYFICAGVCLFLVIVQIDFEVAICFINIFYLSPVLDISVEFSSTGLFIYTGPVMDIK